jgi:hypothetical protein
VFRLAAGGVVELAVQQVAPTCRYAGTLHVHGHAGTNRVRVHARVGKHALRPGTYRINARGPRGRSVLSITILVVGQAPPSAAQLRAARHANVCRGGAGTGTGVSAPRGGDGAAGTGSKTGRTGAAGAEGVGGFAASRPRSSLGGGTGTGGLTAPSSPVQVGLLAVLSLAIFLLGVGSLPRTVIPHPRTAALIARRRPEIAAGGVGALVAFLVAYFF